ncbi:RNA recognition motif-containing protein [Pleurotus pulmonarius]|nr:RNA recognition motif-containing protein [Pleurotus pulmonarius]
MLGKRKEREEGSHGSTLFVSNLPYTATSIDIETLFSDIAPVRSAFVVLEQGTGVSKGVGYVSFALREDAESALETIERNGLSLVGRKLRVQWADHKPKESEKPSPSKGIDERKARPLQPPRPPNDPLAIRTLVVSGLPNSIDSKTIWKKMRKYTGAEDVVWPVNVDGQSDDPTTAHIRFSTPELANKAVDKLHAHIFKGSLLSATLKKRLDKSAHLPVTEGAASAKAATPNRASRLIVRNLPWDTTDQDLRAIFLPYGPIFSIHIPTTPNDKEEETKVRAKGFAFVWMVSKKDAERALAECNGKILRPGLAATLASDKQKKKKQRRIEQKLRAAAEGTVADGADDAETVETGRVIAVDWALSKDKWAEEKAKLEADEEVEKESDVAMESGEESNDEESDDSSGSQLGLHDGDDDDDEFSRDGASDRESEEEPVKPQLPATDVGTTLFVRNVPFTATDDELRTLFRAFGALRYARITMDHETGRSRGTGFACFWNKDDADKVIEQSDLLRAETTGSSITPKANPFTLPSILTPDPSSSLARSLVLHGRTLDVVRAVTRDVAHKLKEEGEKQREKADKRNLYLLREGVIFANTPAAESLSATEVERRTNSYSARKSLLRTNPSLFISKTRLSIRQIPIFVTERMLKRLAIHATRAFEDDVREGRRSALTEDELTNEPVAEEDENVAPAKGKKPRGTRHTGVKQAKIVRQQERIDPITGKGRSKGYGFLEMHKHADALRVLRWANNNAEVMALFRSWWKEELKDLIKVEKERLKETKETDDARLQRMKAEYEGGPPKGGKDTLIVEFSIENIQVVQRRAALASNPSKRKDREMVTGDSKPPPKARRSQTDAPSNDDEDEVKPSPKRRRTASTGALLKPAKQPDELGNKLGSLIGRKRKQRMAKKK